MGIHTFSITVPHSTLASCWGIGLVHGAIWKSRSHFTAPAYSVYAGLFYFPLALNIIKICCLKFRRNILCRLWWLPANLMQVILLTPAIDFLPTPRFIDLLPIPPDKKVHKTAMFTHTLKLCEQYVSDMKIIGILYADITSIYYVYEFLCSFKKYVYSYT